MNGKIFEIKSSLLYLDPRIEELLRLISKEAYEDTIGWY